MSKYIFITGGVVSGLGKGITAASLGKLMKARGLGVEIVKFNPYFNIDSFNLCPKQYGEIFITDDGRSCDLVIGHYERIMGESLTSKNDVTSGEIYRLIIEKERQNFYDGMTVQVVPHITDEIKQCIMRVGEKADIVIVEVGGTVGDIEAQPYMEAIRQLKANLGKANVAYIHVSLITYIDVSGELKTKPTQHSVKELQNLGIQPDVIVCRSDYPLDLSGRNKLALFCNVEKDCVIESMIKPNIYEIPLMLEEQGLCSAVLRKLRLDERPADLSRLKDFCEKIKQLELLDYGGDATDSMLCAQNDALKSKSVNLKNENDKNDTIKIGIIDKNADKYEVNMSVRHALLFSGVELNAKIEVVGICAGDYSDDKIKGLDGIIISSEVSDEAIAAKARAIDYAFNNNLPVLMLGDSAFLGLGAGHDKNTFKAPRGKTKSGAYPVDFTKGSQMHKAFGKLSAEQRFKSEMYLPKSYFDGLNLTLSGVCADGSACAYEKSGHKFYAGVFFRPEFTARPQSPSKIITAFLSAAKNK